MKICIFPCSNKGGIDTYTKELARAIRERTNYEVCTVGDIRIATKKGLIPQIDLPDIKTKSMYYTPFPTLELGYKYSKLINDMAVDIAHSGSSSSMAFVRINVPLIVTAWFYPSSLLGSLSIINKYTNWWKFPFATPIRLQTSFADVLGYKKASKIICVTKALEKDLLDKGYNSIYIPPAIEIMDTNSNKKYDKITIIFISYDLANKRKGLEYLLDALNEIKKCRLSKEEFILKLIGNPSKRLFDLVSMYEPLKKNIEITGTLPRDETLSTLSKSHILVAPSVYEEFGYTVLEAMMLGIPVIASDIHSFQDLISDKVGFLINIKNRKEFVEKLSLLMNEENIREEMGKNARRRVTKKFSWDVILPNVIKLYRSLEGEEES